MSAEQAPSDATFANTPGQRATAQYTATARKQKRWPPHACSKSCDSVRRKTGNASGAAASSASFPSRPAYVEVNTCSSATAARRSCSSSTGVSARCCSPSSSGATARAVAVAAAAAGGKAGQQGGGGRPAVRPRRSPRAAGWSCPRWHASAWGRRAASRGYTCAAPRGFFAGFLTATLFLPIGFFMVKFRTNGGGSGGICVPTPAAWRRRAPAVVGGEEAWRPRQRAAPRACGVKAVTSA